MVSNSSSPTEVLRDDVRVAPPSRRSWVGPLALALLIGGSLAGVSLIDGSDESPTAPFEAATPPSGLHLKNDPASMPDVLSERAKSVLGDLVTGKPVKFVPLTDQLQELPISKAGAAKSAYTDLGSKDSGRVWRVYVAASGADAGTGSCDGVPAGIVCEVIDTDAGPAVHTTVTAIRDPQFPQSFTLVENPSSLTADQLKDVRIDSSVRFVSGDGSQTSATETVYGPAAADSSAFLAAPGTLATLASDPELRW